MSGRLHWEAIYARKSIHEVSWYRRHLDTSLELILRAGIAREAPIVDAGGGASTLVDDLF